MKNRLILLIIILNFSLLYVGCEKGILNMDDVTETQTITLTPSPINNKQESTNDLSHNNVEYVIDVLKNWNEDDYKETFGMDLLYFDSPIMSPYQYTYQCEDELTTIEQIATALGMVMMNNFMRDYEGKTFTVTEYHNLNVDVMSEEECSKWESDYYRIVGNKLVINENQWLCTYTCEYKYTGVYANIGEMPSDWEWMTTMTADGSGEDYVFIIQKNANSEYSLRAMPKSVKEVKE